MSGPTKIYIPKLFNWDTESGRTGSNRPPTLNIRSVTKQSDGYYTITLDFKYDVTLKNCVEIFPDMRYFAATYPPTKEEDEIVSAGFKKDASPELKNQAILILMRATAREKSLIFNDLNNNKYYLWIDGVYNENQIATLKRNIVMCHMQLQDVKNILSMNSPDGADNAATNYFQGIVSKSVIKISPYDTTKLSSSFTTGFFTGTSNSSVAVDTGSSPVIIIIVVLLLIAAAAAGVFYMKNKTEKNNSFGRYKKRKF